LVEEQNFLRAGARFPWKISLTSVKERNPALATASLRAMQPGFLPMIP
jgi:hypothetical protein